MSLRIDGKSLAERVRAEVKKGASAFRAAHGRPPGLTVVIVGDDAASHVYVNNKERASSDVGFFGQVHRLPATTSEGEVLRLIERLNNDALVDGILVQLPLPVGFSPDAVIDALDPRKDVDGLHPLNAGALWSDKPALVPCTPRGCLGLLEEAKVPLAGARALVVGRSKLVGKPVAALLLKQNATVTIAHSRTLDLPARCREADVLIAAAGQPKMILGDWIKPGATVIDVGIHREANGKLCGDVDFESAERVAGAITPVPGGVGPMTIAMLLENTLLAARRRLGDEA